MSNIKVFAELPHGLVRDVNDMSPDEIEAVDINPDLLPFDSFAIDDNADFYKKFKGSKARIFENKSFDLNINNPGAASAASRDRNWGFSSDGIDLSLFTSLSLFGAGVRIGTADTGLDSDHDVFSDLVVENRLIAFADFDFDGNKILQSDLSGQTVSDENAKPIFSDWHGTHTACILVGGEVDGIRRGIAPEAELVVAKITNSRKSFSSAFDWLATQNCDFVSLSLGEPGKHEVYASSIKRIIDTGCIAVIAAGNEHIYEGTPSRSPANYPIDGIIAVGAHDIEGDIWPKSGGESISWPRSYRNALGELIPSVFSGMVSHNVPTLSAPGVDIVSAQPLSGYYKESGTSMATPHVVGLLALILSTLRIGNPSALPQEAVDILLDCVADAGAPGVDSRFGLGLVDSTKLASRLAELKPQA